jgi:methylthioribose-1-phosphate isomerase
MSEIEPVRWHDDHLELLDQTLLPRQIEWRVINTYQEAMDAIRRMVVRGAPAIGVAAAYALVLASRQVDESSMPAFLARLEEAGQELSAARPTAVNLGWAVHRGLGVARLCASPGDARRELLREAQTLHQEDIAANRAMGRHGADLLPSDGGVLTHCNAGALATGGYGTAIGVIRSAWEQGKRFHVFCTETRPWLQGARLTAWELVQLGIPSALVVDSAAGSLMGRGEVHAVVVGADRIVANGDVANKIGTYSLAVLAKEHGIPFYVAAPTSTVDLSIASGGDVIVEERPVEEVTSWAGVPTAAPGISVRNPAFDITPSKYVSAIITEHGVVRAPYVEGLSAQLSQRPSEAAV